MTRWTERQAQMLHALGLRLWLPQPRVAEAAEVTGLASAAAVIEPSRDAAPPLGGFTAQATAAATPSVTAPATVHRPARADALPAVSAMAAAAAATQPAVAAMDWSALRQAVGGCRACALCEGRTQTVFGAGNARAHWLIVGEPPSVEEDAAGEPFVGPAGPLLSGMLHALGLLHPADGAPDCSVYLTHALKCRPPVHRNPEAQEVQRCAPFLQRQMALLQPRVVLAMGSLAAQAVLNDARPLGQLRGQVHKVGRTPVVVTYQPTYLLRNPTEKAKTWEDLCLAADVAERALD